MKPAPSWPLALLPQRWMLYRLPPEAPWPQAALTHPWAFLARTPEEVSLLLPEEVSPPRAGRVQGPWRALRVATTLDLSLIGVLAGLSQILAAAEVPLLAFSTFDTDYLFVPAERLTTALQALRQAGYPVVEEHHAR